jgi:lysine 6-dehydrogenase
LVKNIVDISFFPENALDLDELALSKGVTAVVDFGVAPGMMHFILGYHNKTMQIDSFTCYVGGLPVERTYPYEYKAPFSPIDVIEEYTRPARLVENGKVVTKPALSEPELLYFKEIGTLEAFKY